MNKHTTTPWISQRISEEDTEWTASEIIGSNDYFVSTMVCKQVDAEHIVRCVNSHDALVKALETVKQYAGVHLYPELREFIDDTLAAAGAPQ